MVSFHTSIDMNPLSQLSPLPPMPVKPLPLNVEQITGGATNTSVSFSSIQETKGFSTTVKAESQEHSNASLSLKKASSPSDSASSTLYLIERRFVMKDTQITKSAAVESYKNNQALGIEKDLAEKILEESI